jgi:ketosteroid isomerase-like protein
MSQENVEVVKAGFDAWNAGDMDAVREVYHPDAIVRPPENWPEPGPFVGRDAVMRESERLRDAWDTDTAEPIADFIDVADRVVVRLIWHGAGRGPDAELEMTQVNTVRGARSSPSIISGTMPRPSKPWGWRSKTLTPTPEPPFLRDALGGG